VNEPAEFVRLLEGQECRALLTQEVWHRGALSDLLNVLFLQVGDGRWARFFFDAGAFFWREAGPVAVTGGEPEWEYRIVDVGSRLRVSGQRIARVEFVQPDPGCARLVIFLERGRLILDNADDRSRLAFVETVA
jgi:hypothetical protein